jgi:hypothetical protein
VTCRDIAVTSGANGDSGLHGALVSWKIKFRFETCVVLACLAGWLPHYNW